MDRKYALKRALSNRYALTAVCFLAILLWGSLTVLFGVLDLSTACKGFAAPQAQVGLVKADPTVPNRGVKAPAATLEAPAPVRSPFAQLSAGTDKAEKQVTRALEEDHSLIQVYGAYQRFAGRTVVEDPAAPQYTVVRLPEGALTFVGTGTPDPKAQAAGLKRLQQALAEKNASLLYLQAPSKLEPGRDDLPWGVEDTSNACADALLAELDALEVDYLDFRQTLKDAGGSWTDWFYTTDHHWTQPAAFLAFQELAAKLSDYDQTLSVSWGTKQRPISIPERYTDPASFASATLPGFFLGSQGKRVGSLYAGADDFSLHTPAFPTLMGYQAGSDGARFGSADETVLFPERVERRDWFSATPYTYYAGGDYGFAQVNNYYNSTGPRILLIRDSYACAITPYLALCAGQLTTIDPRHFSGDLLSYVDWLRPDVVLVLYSSGMVREEQSFRLLAQPSVPGKSGALRWKTDWYEGER